MSSQANNYLYDILKKYSASKYYDANEIKENIRTLIMQWAGNSFNDFFVMGSYAKGTRIVGSGDIDFFISIDNTTTMTLKEIYESLYNFLSQNNMSPRKQNVSIRINLNGIYVDVVPGKTQTGYINYHSLFKNKSQTWIQTNVKSQIDLISKSNRTGEIKCLKIWKKIHNLEFPSYYLELTVLKALRGRDYNDIARNFTFLLAYLRDNFKDDTIEDPTKPSNIVSDDLSGNEKSLIETTAAVSLEKTTWPDVIW